MTAVPVPKTDPSVTQTRGNPEMIPDSPPADRPSARRGGVAAGPRRHTVARDETFATISQQYYGSARYDRALWWFNRGVISRPDRLSPGDLIVIPRQRARFISGAGPPVSSRAPRRAPPYHVVRRYETLRSIARDRLGDSRRADEIIELNQDRLPESNQLRPGLRLLLPSDAAPEPQAP